MEGIVPFIDVTLILSRTNFVNEITDDGKVPVNLFRLTSRHVIDLIL